MARVSDLYPEAGPGTRLKFITRFQIQVIGTRFLAVII